MVMCYMFGLLRTIATILGVMVWAQINAQQPAHRVINKQSGLPANAVYNIVQDKQNFIWLGTDKGLWRYDGLHFKQYLGAEQNGTSDLRIGHDGKIRCQSFSGIHQHVANDSLYVDHSWPQIGNFAPVLVYNKDTSYQYARHKVYIHTTGGNTQLRFQHELYGIYEYHNKVYCFDSVGIYELPARLQVATLPFQWRGQTVFFTVNFQDKVLSIPKRTRDGEIYQLMPEAIPVKIPIQDAKVQSVRVLRDTLLFICTNNGLYVLDKKLQQVSIKQPLLYNKNLSDAYETTDGRIWVTTLDGAIFIYDNWGAVLYETPDPVTCVSISAATGNLLAGTSGGEVFEWRTQGNFRSIFKTKERQQVVAVQQIEKNTKLIAADAFMIQQAHKLTEQLNLAVKKIVPVDTLTYLLGRTGGFNLLTANPKYFAIDKKAVYNHEKWKLFELYEANEGNLRVNAMAAGDGFLVYAATTIGLLKITINGYNELMPDGKRIILNDIAYYKGKLYGISGNTLIEIDLTTAQSTIKEFPNAISAFRNIRANHMGLWLSSTSKLYHVTDIHSEAMVYDWNNGWEINDFCFAGDDAFLAGEKGVIKVSLTGQLNTNNDLNVYVEELTDGENNFATAQNLRLPHRQNNLLLRYSVPYFGNPDDITVYYRVNNGKWQKTEQGQREIKFISLDPSKYLVELMAESVTGQQSHIQAVRFQIRPPFWKTWWFYILSMGTVAAVAYVLYRYRVKLIEQQNTLERQKIDLENKLRESILASVKAQMNPHFIYNALNTIQSFIYLNDKQNATSYLGKFSQLTRTILDMSTKNSVSLQEELDAILLYLELEKMRFDDDMNYAIEVAPNIDAGQLFIPSMIIQPYIENAVKHGLLHKKGDKWLKCSFQMEGKFLKVIIDDNGIGRARSSELNKKKNRKPQSFATQANEKRLEVLNREHSDSVNVVYRDKVSPDGQPQGTTVEIKIALVDG